MTEELARLRDAQNRHDLNAFVACFDPQYRSEQPVHPDRAFVGRQQVRSNWAEVFAGVPDFRAELLRSAEQDDTGWAEWHWHGTRTDGTRLDMRGVTIFGVRDDRISWGRLYVEDVEGGQGIDQAVQHMARGSEQARPVPTVEFALTVGCENKHGGRMTSGDAAIVPLTLASGLVACRGCCLAAGRSPPVRRLSSGGRLSSSEMDELAPEAASLLQPERLWSRAEVLGRPSPVPVVAGTYAWDFKQLPAAIDTTRCVSGTRHRGRSP